MQNYIDVDWALIPSPADDGDAQHLTGIKLASLELPATDGTVINLSALTGLTVVYIFPRTGRPGKPMPEGWDAIPGARGCTPQSCAFRDHYTALRDIGVQHLFGLSVQSQAYQQEAVERLHLPFPLLSDADMRFAAALNLPRFVAEGVTLLKRVTLIIRDGTIVKVFYPIFPPDQNPMEVISWITNA